MISDIPFGWKNSSRYDSHYFLWCGLMLTALVHHSHHTHAHSHAHTHILHTNQTLTHVHTHIRPHVHVCITCNHNALAQPPTNISVYDPTKMNLTVVTHGKRLPACAMLGYISHRYKHVARILTHTIAHAWLGVSWGMVVHCYDHQTSTNAGIRMYRIAVLRDYPTTSAPDHAPSWSLQLVC